MGETIVKCEHGREVGHMQTNHPLECQECDWCPMCEGVRRYDGETCTACGYEWGTA